MLNQIKSMSSFSIPHNQEKFYMNSCWSSPLCRRIGSPKLSSVVFRKPLSLGVYSTDNLRNYSLTNFRLELPRPVARLETDAKSVESTIPPLPQVQQTQECLWLQVQGAAESAAHWLHKNHFLSSEAVNFAWG